MAEKDKSLKEKVDDIVGAGGAFLNDPSGKNRAAQQEQALRQEARRIAAEANVKAQSEQDAAAIAESNKPPRANVNEPEEIKSGDTGQLRGAEFPDGRVLLGLRPSVIRKMLENQAAKSTAGAAPAGTSREGQEALQEGAALAGSVGSIGNVGGQATPLDQSQANLAGLRGAIGPGLAGAGSLASAGALAGLGFRGAATGARTGIAAGLPGVVTGALVGAAIGLISGAVAGFINGRIDNLQNQAKGNIAANQITLRESEGDLRKDIAAAWGGGNKAPLVEDFNARLADIERGYTELKLATEQDVNLFLSQDGSAQLQRYAEFYRPGGAREQLIAEMRLALSSTPNSERAIQFMTDDEIMENIPQ